MIETPGGGPVQLLQEDPEEGWQIDTVQLEAMLKDEKVKDRQLVVVSVVGEKRRGKSFLLNFMLRYLRCNGCDNWIDGDDVLEGFSWWGGPDGDTTTGILVWPEVFLVGEDKAMILLDTQGLVNSKRKLKENSEIFALVTLASSVQVFNVAEKIEMDLLINNLKSFSDFGKLTADECAGSKALQKFVFLVRDFASPNKKFGFLPGEKVLQEWQQNSDSSSREMTQTCFSDVSCFLLPYPGKTVTDEDYKGSLNSGVNVIFVDKLEGFVEEILGRNQLVSKKVGGHVMIAKEFVPYLTTCMGALEKSIFQPDKLFQSLAEVSHQKAARAALEEYEARLQTGGTTDPYDEAKTAALKLFDESKIFGSKKRAEDARKKLVQELEKFEEMEKEEEMNAEGAVTIVPVQLLVKDASEKFQLQTDQLEAMLKDEKVKDRQLVVVSVVGAFRRGKSFLLNFMLRYLRCNGEPGWMEKNSSKLKDGFSWRGGPERDTTGLQVWPEVFLVGEKLAIILVDTQGTFDNKTTLEQNTLIFALSTLLSSVQIFNIFERIQMDDISNLQYFTEFGRQVESKLKKKAFQKLIFLIRDWKFATRNKFGYNGGREVLGKWLKPAAGSPGAQEAEMIVNCFSDIDCFLMPHPGQKVSAGVRFRGDVKDIEPQFLDHLSSFISSVLSPSSLVVKQVGGHAVTAEDLPPYLRACMGALQGGDLQPDSLVQSITAMAVKRVLGECTRVYRDVMDSSCRRAESVDFPKVHKMAFKMAVKHFAKALGKTLAAENTGKLKKEISGHQDSYKSNNDQKLQRELEIRKRERLQNVKDQSVRQYERNMSGHCAGPRHNPRLQDKHELEKQKTLALFDSVASQFESKDVKPYLDEVTKLIQSKYSYYEASNSTKLQQDKEDLKTTVRTAMTQYKRSMTRDKDQLTENGVNSRHDMCRGVALRGLESLEQQMGKAACVAHRKDMEKEMSTIHQSLLQEVQLRIKREEAVKNVRAAKSSAITLYKNSMTSVCARTKAIMNLGQEHRELKKAVLRQFDNVTAKNCSDESSSLRNDIVKSIDEMFSNFDRENDKKLQKERREEMMEELTEAVDVGISKYRDNMNDFLSHGTVRAGQLDAYSRKYKDDVTTSFRDVADQYDEDETSSYWEQLLELMDTEHNEHRRNNNSRLERERRQRHENMSSAVESASLEYRSQLTSRCSGMTSLVDMQRLERGLRNEAKEAFSEAARELNDSDVEEEYQEKFTKNMNSARTEIERVVERNEQELRAEREAEEERQRELERRREEENEQVRQRARQIERDNDCIIL